MKRPVCANCFEYPENCKGCKFPKCSICQTEIPDGEAYEYRGTFSCEKHFDEMCVNREYQREQVMQQVEASTRSQRIGEFVHNRKKYNVDNVASDGLPIVEVQEPECLKDYESSL